MSLNISSLRLFAACSYKPTAEGLPPSPAQHSFLFFRKCSCHKHPEPLTDSGHKPLDLSGSCHPLKAAAFHRDRRVPPVNPLTLFDRDAGDLLPSLLGHYLVSTLLRSSPPLGGASVLSASWFVHLCLFSYYRHPGSQVPHESPD